MVARRGDPRRLACYRRRPKKGRLPMNAANRLTGAAVVRRVLQRYGVKTVFALAGASQTRLLDDLDRHGVRVVSTRHETATVGAADGYSRVTGRVGVAMINVDQGMFNAVTGVASAFEACSPVVILVGREEDAWTEPENQIDHDELALLRPISKWARTVRSPQRLGEYVDAACRRALAGRPGPTVVAFAKDYLGAAVDVAGDLDLPFAAAAGAAPPAAAVEQAVDLLTRSERPIVIAGSGAFRAKAGPALRRLAHDYRIPVLTNALARGLVPEDEALGWSWPLAQTAAKEADCVLWLGARLGKRFGYGLAPRFDARAKMIQVDVHADELGRNRPVELPINADAGLTGDALVGALERRRFKPKDAGWLKAALADRLRRIDALGRDDQGPIHPFRIGRDVMAEMPKDAIVVNDGASILVWMFAVLRMQTEGGYMDHFPVGSMGMGTPLAVGAAAGTRDLAAEQGGSPRPIVLVTGDGSFGFYPSEFDGAVQAGFAPFVTVIANNGVWGNEYHTQQRLVGRHINAHFGKDVRYDVIARGYGCHAERVDQPTDLRPALRRAFAAGRPAVLDVVAPEPDMRDPALATIIYSDVEETRKKHFAARE
ncbi:MAG: thiamine pyrophosphate-binding protein [Alphaproteobacteria bacterium]|nr:thiamine pyrophosphate-binding protein [Alphaproteobacteria bacterium]